MRLGRPTFEAVPRLRARIVKFTFVDHNEAPESLRRLRQICLALPGTTERLSHGEPTWFIREKKSFATFAHHHHDDRVGFWCAAPAGLQHSMVDTDPLRFFVPPYVGHRGWLGVYLDVPVDWIEIADIVETAYRAIAPIRLVAELDR
jgi:predicted DNA-binding protein (MmcQ/YjbR family)